MSSWQRAADSTALVGYVDPETTEQYDRRKHDENRWATEALHLSEIISFADGFSWLNISRKLWIVKYSFAAVG